jgi:glycosyltransferase involved in cell wall biosynthesis
MTSDNPLVLHILAPMREGGLERVVAMMSTGRPTSVHVAAVVEPGSAHNHPFIEQLEALGIPVTPIVVGARSYFREYRSLGALVMRLRPGIIHTHGYRADLIGGTVARAHDIPTVSTAHGFTGGGRRNRFYEWLQMFALRRADAVIAVSSPLAQRLVDDGVPPMKIHCIPNGFKPLVATVSRATARKALGLPASTLVAGWVGRLSTEKGADVMLEALAECHPRWRLSIIGDGAEFARLRQQAEALRVSDRVTWHGSIANAGSLLSAFDAFVLSSRTEGAPITLFEAMNAGVPIIATRVGGVPHIINDSHAVLVPTEEPRAIAEALAELERDAAGAASRSQRARERLLKSFSLGSWLDAVDDVYRIVAN